MRPARDATAVRSDTPIYDELYAEWRRSFRALPGDRTGEEDLTLTVYNNRQPYAPHGPADPSLYSRHHEHTAQAAGSWYPPERHHGARPPAALPPAPRTPRWERA